MKNNLFATTLAAFALALLYLPAWGHSGLEAGLPGKYIATYFSTRDGVEEGLVNDIIQDRKGLLWFATWNGLYRFDGYGFRNYKSSTQDEGGLTNDRLQQIAEDRAGCIWVLCYDSTAYRFRPDREVFEPVCQRTVASVRTIRVLPGGAVWLLFADGSALRVVTQPADLSLEPVLYSRDARTLPAGRVQTVVEDAAGQEWILTDDGLYCLADGQLSTVVGGDGRHAFYCAEQAEGTLLLGGSRGRTYVCGLKEKRVAVRQLETTAAIRSILSDGQATLFVTDSDGFFAGDSTGGFRHITLEGLALRKDKTIESATVTRHRLLWLTHPGPGVTLFDLATRKFREFVGRDEIGRPLQTETGFFAIEDPNGVLWVHPKGGAFSYYDPRRRELVPFNTTEQPIKWKSNDRCFSAFADRQGNLWMSTQLNRLKRVRFIPDRFGFHLPSPDDPNLPENEIRALFVDRKGRLWTGGRDLNVSVYDAGGFKLLHRFRAGKVYAITQDAGGVFWLSTKGEGLIKATEGPGGRFGLERFGYRADDPYSISSDNVYHVFQDGKGRLWVATYGGGLNLIERQANGRLRFISHRNRLHYPIQRFHKTRHITEDREGNIWVSTTAGILHFDGNFGEPEAITFGQICREPGNGHSLSNNDVHMIRCTAGGKRFAATYGGGLNEIRETGKGIYGCDPFMQKDELLSDIIYAMEEDPDGGLWVVTGGGLVRFADTHEQTRYPSEDIAFNLHFSEGAGATNGKRIFFGTNRGILYFDPAKIRKTDFVPQLFFSSVWVNNRELSPKDTPDLLPASIDNSPCITLPPNNHSLRIIFSAPDMAGTEHIHYAYMLRGFDSAYQHTDYGHEANYTNLPPGNYTFYVRSTNSEGVWVDNERTLPIEVLPTFAQTPCATVLLCVLILLAGLAVIYIYTVFYRMKQKVKNEEYLARLKLDFFTNVSHELRTPLTLITGPLEMILNNGTLPDELKEQLNTIRRNSLRMQRLVGQILDYSKVQGNKMRLRVRRIDIAGLAQNIVGHFAGIAHERHITITYNSVPPVCYLWIDEDKIEKALFNLISNAFKYTPDHKHIRVEVDETANTVTIRVTDQGAGIAPGKQESIFNRNSGTAHGLSIAKELAEMHHGNITVDSREGTGSTFTLTLPKGKQHYDDGTEYIVGDGDTEDETPSGQPGEPGRENAPLLLIVEDNAELRQFVKRVFQTTFRILEAQDGSEGLEKTLTHFPDIVITDITMPVKDGLTMLHELRNDERTSHIPAILLTAKSDMDNVLTGIRTGADDYITKPFSVSYLQSKVENLLAQRKRLQAYYSRNTSAPATAGGWTEKDKTFLNRLNELMEAQMSNPDLSVDHLVSNFNLSRTNFTHKLKSLTGHSPVLYIRNARMRKAAELIGEHRYTMAEIAYEVGYSDPHYFSRIFKSFWGMNATEYARNPN
ncbi:MAG: response regulator [Mediterranea sp.]|jgi:signal transduction histidine kinase/DNA-binding response OmpR family regulator/ligand-binding sensor domain-containing protein|nr:response regulator [Mediterranea sp.]